MNKYRVWDKERKEWVRQTGNPYIFPFEGITAMICAGNSTGHISLEDFSEYYKIMLFTGFKDEDGKEIYEGDILSGDYPDEVFWDKNRGQWMLNNYDGPDDTLWEILKFNKPKIIGNIYENPDLLKDSK